METRPRKQKMSRNKQHPQNRRNHWDEDPSLRDPEGYSRREKHRQPNYRDWLNEDLDD